MRSYNAPGNYVSAEAQPGELDPLMEHALTQTLERDVLVPILQNMAGGLGVFVVIMAICFGLIDYGYLGVTINSVLWAALYSGLVAFGLACAWRAFRDEWKEALYHWARGWSAGRTSKELDFLEEEVDRLRLENRQLSAQMAQMVKNVRVSVQTDELPQNKPQAIRDAYTEPLRDANYLCRFHDSHGTIAREKVMSAGQLTKSRWESARQLLIDSGVPINNGVFGAPVVVAMSRVREFVERQRRSSVGFVQPPE